MPRIAEAAFTRGGGGVARLAWCVGLIARLEANICRREFMTRRGHFSRGSRPAYQGASRGRISSLPMMLRPFERDLTRAFVNWRGRGSRPDGSSGSGVRTPGSPRERSKYLCCLTESLQRGDRAISARRRTRRTLMIIRVVLSRPPISGQTTPSSRGSVAWPMHGPAPPRPPGKGEHLDEPSGTRAKTDRVLLCPDRASPLYRLAALPDRLHSTRIGGGLP